MIVYWFLLLITAAVAYSFGSVSTLSIAGVFVFHSNLHRIGKKQLFVSNFRRLYGYLGFLKLFAVELVRDLLPVLLGGLLLSIQGHADVGRAFAVFCLVLGRLFPVFNRFRGSTASLCLAIGMFCVNSSVGISALIAVAAVTWFSRYPSLGAIAAAVMTALVTVLVADGTLLILLCVLSAAIVLIRNLPALSRISQGKEFRLSMEEDISYKFEERF
ncbi:MAG: glycerol-3-phosphate acyltransferase [Oscillospiraceae bacterium]|nr:glycerol-3-phosphate acyltransferase [Oscillospiraceae bacterium]